MKTPVEKFPPLICIESAGTPLSVKQINLTFTNNGLSSEQATQFQHMVLNYAHQKMVNNPVATLHFALENLLNDGADPNQIREMVEMQLLELIA